MSPEEDRIAGEATKRGAMLPPAPPSSAMQARGMSRETGVTPVRSPMARTPPAKVWDGSFAKVREHSVEERPSHRGSSSRESAEKAERKRHAHNAARAELLLLIAEHAGDSGLWGPSALESFNNGDIPLRVALPPPKLAMLEIKARREKQQAAEEETARRTEKIESLRKQHRLTAAALREKRKENGGDKGSAEDGAAVGTPTRVDSAGTQKYKNTRYATKAAERVADKAQSSTEGLEDNETTPVTTENTPGAPITSAEQVELTRKLEVAAFIQESKARWRVKLAQEKTAARLRETRRLEILKRERGLAREKAAAELAAERDAANQSTSVGVGTQNLNAWNAGAPEKEAFSEAPLAPARAVGTRSFASKESIDTAEATTEKVSVANTLACKVAGSSSASRARLGTPVVRKIPESGKTSGSGFSNNTAPKRGDTLRSSTERKPPAWLEDESKKLKALRESAVGSRLGGSAFVTNTGLVTAETRRVRGEEAKTRLRKEIENRLAAAKAAARATAEDVSLTMETLVSKRASVLSRSIGSIRSSSARSDARERDNRVMSARLKRFEIAKAANNHSPTLALPSSPHVSPGKGVLRVGSVIPPKSSSERHISFSNTVATSDGVATAMADALSELPETPGDGTSAFLPKPDAEAEADAVPGVLSQHNDDFESETLKSKPRLVDQMRGPPSTCTALPGNEHVPRTEDWLGQGQGGRAGRFLARRLAKRRAPIDSDSQNLTLVTDVPSSAQASDALAATAFARQGGSTGVRKKEAVVDAASVAAAYVHARSITQKKKAKEEPCGILSTYARRVFAAQVVETTQTPVVVDLETTTERAARHSCATTSAQTEVVFFVDENKAPTATRKSKKDKKDKKARKENKPKKSSEKRKKRTTIAAPRDDLGDDDSSVESLVAPGEFLYGQTVTRSLPGDQRFAKLASASVDEADADNAVETLRATPDDLYKRLHSELALYDEMGDISSELDAMRLARDTFDAEQAASTFASLANSRLEALTEIKQAIDAAKEYEQTVRTEEKLTLREQAMRLVGDGSVGAWNADTAASPSNPNAPPAVTPTPQPTLFTEADVRRVAEAVTTSVREESLAHLKDVTDLFLANVARGQADASDVAAAALQARFESGSAAAHVERLDEDDVNKLAISQQLTTYSPLDTDSIADELGAASVSGLSESFIPVEIPDEEDVFGAEFDVDKLSDDEASALREVVAKHDDLQRRLLAKQKQLRADELTAKRYQIAELEKQLAALDEDEDSKVTAPVTREEASSALAREVDDSTNVRDKLEAHELRIQHLTHLVNTRRAEALATLSGKEVALQTEMRRLDREIYTANSASEASAAAEASPDRSAKSPSPSPIPPAPCSASSTETESVDSGMGEFETGESPAFESNKELVAFETGSPTQPALTTNNAFPAAAPVATRAYAFDPNVLKSVATASRVECAVRIALDVSGAFRFGLTPETLRALRDENTFEAVMAGVPLSLDALSVVTKNVDAQKRAAQHAKLATPGELVYDTILECVDGLVSENSFPTTTALAGNVAGGTALAGNATGVQTKSKGGLVGDLLFETVATKAKTSLALPARVAAADSTTELNDTSGGDGTAPTKSTDTTAPLDAICRDDARASDDVGWYAVRAVENAIAKRLADELFDEVLADTVMAMAGVR